MYTNERLLMRSKKSNSVIVYGLIIIFIFVFVPIYAICMWMRWFFEKGESSLTSLNSNETLIILATPIFLSAFAVYALYLGILTITAHQTEILFFEHHIECKCVNSKKSTGILVLNVRYDQVEAVSPKGSTYLLLTVSGQQYSVAAKNVEQCIQMIAEMKYRNMQFYHNSYYPS